MIRLSFMLGSVDVTPLVVLAAQVAAGGVLFYVGRLLLPPLRTWVLPPARATGRVINRPLRSPWLFRAVAIALPLVDLLTGGYLLSIAYGVELLLMPSIALNVGVGVTLRSGAITRTCANNLAETVNITNGPRGVYDADPIWLGGYSFGTSHQVLGFTIPAFLNYYYLSLLVILLTIFLVGRLAASRVGRAWAAIREDELA